MMQLHTWLQDNDCLSQLEQFWFSAKKMLQQELSLQQQTGNSSRMSDLRGYIHDGVSHALYSMQQSYYASNELLARADLDPRMMLPEVVDRGEQFGGPPQSPRGLTQPTN